MLIALPQWSRPASFWYQAGAGATRTAVTGDPPNNLREFKAYHYAVGSAALIAVAWFIWVAHKFRSRHRWWVLFVCGAWCAWVFWVGFWFLRELHRHPAGEYYWSIW